MFKQVVRKGIENRHKITSFSCHQKIAAKFLKSGLGLPTYTCDACLTILEKQLRIATLPLPSHKPGTCGMPSYCTTISFLFFPFPSSFDRAIKIILHKVFCNRRLKSKTNWGPSDLKKLKMKQNERRLMPTDNQKTFALLFEMHVFCRAETNCYA